jgi:anaerobic dimethyl sulfoxide reductase subunit C (anchor subunit)
MMNVREWALPVYTILMQLAIGSLGVLWILRTLLMSKYHAEGMEQITRNPIAIILITVIAGMLGSFFHLSRPYIAFLAILNILSSWLSREIFFTVLLFGAVAILWIMQAHVDGYYRIKTALGWTAFASGLATIFCMSHLYTLPVQASWNVPFTTISFYTTAALLGTAACLTMITVDMQYSQLTNPDKPDLRPQIIRQILPGMAIAILVEVIISFASYANLMQTLESNSSITAHASLDLYMDLYHPLLILRLAVMFTGALWVIVSVTRTLKQKMSLSRFTAHAYFTCLLLLIGEILGRFLFYATHIRIGL